MRQIEMRGKTRKDAIQAALDKLGKELHEVRVEIIDEGSKGFLGLGARDVVVRVTVEGDEGGGGGNVDLRGNDAGALLQEIIARMGMTAEVSTQFMDDGTIRLNIDSPDSAILIGRKGKTLSALQYLINRMVNTGEDPEKVERIAVDIEGYVERRRDTLEEIAQRSAQRAKETGKRVRLKPLDPQERRLIHMALQGDPDVETYSVGNAQIRSVIIQPKGMSQLSEEEADREAPSDDRHGGGRSREGRGGRDRGRRGGGDRGGRDRGGDRGGARSSERGGERPADRGPRPERGDRGPRPERGGDRGRDRDRGPQGPRRDDAPRRGDQPPRRNDSGPRPPMPAGAAPSGERQAPAGREEQSGRHGTRRRRRPVGGSREGQQDQASTTPRSNALYGPDPNYRRESFNAPPEGGETRREGENS
ncbi:MAG: RNA-binding cell elongation regulator Jag/EloR [FCB group bacterium]|jgi:spoIIIJ-associated protein|nr:RNA-binding cell elongation regulator Jag/EloR [FCB group bacterium]